MKRSVKLFIVIGALLSFGVLSAQDVKIVEMPSGNIIKEEKMVLKRKVAIGRFSNETQYAKGIFYDKANDPIGKQALDILSSKLAASGKFLLLERDDIASLLKEKGKKDGDVASIGADYVIIGSVTEYGRKNIGKTGILSSENTQMVEAAVAVRLVDVSTGLIIYSDEAKGSAEITAKNILGIGSQASFDATLSDKAISMAIGQLVENIINKCTNSPWKTYFLSYDSDAILIAGGKSQGVREGMIFSIMKKGKKVKNPQTGIEITLPGKKVGELKIISSAGDTPETEYSFVEIIGTPDIDNENLNNYIIEELK